jgi:hypothetical protein
MGFLGEQLVVGLDDLVEQTSISILLFISGEALRLRAIPI